MAAPTPSTTPLKIASRFAHLAFRPSGQQQPSSSAAAARDVRDPTPLANDTPIDLSPTKSAAGSNAVKPSRSSPFFSASAPEVKEEPGADGGLSPSKSGYFSPTTKAPSRKRKASTATEPKQKKEAYEDDLQLPPKKQFAPVRPYVAPEGKYASLSTISDKLTLENDICFCGINPGVSSSQRGHHYAGPTNRFWPVIHNSGIIPDVVTYKDDARLPKDYNLGLTNLVDRPTTAASELSVAADMRPGVRTLLDKILAFRPQIVCFVGKEIWQEFRFVVAAAQRLRTGQSKGDRKGQVEWNEPRQWKVVHPGEHGVRETYFWVVSSTSGLCRDKMEQRLESWSRLNDFKREILSRRAFNPASIAATPIGEWDLASFSVVDADAVAEWVDLWTAKLALKTTSGDGKAK